jgi:hypothetical protein
VYEADLVSATWPTDSDLCSPTAPSERFARLKLYRVLSPPYILTATSPKKVVLDIEYGTPCVVLGVEDPTTGNWVAKTSTGVGRLVVGMDTNADGVPDTGKRIISENVKRFVVSSKAATLDELDVTIELELKTGNKASTGGSELEKALTAGQILISRYDSVTMQ